MSQESHHRLLCSLQGQTPLLHLRSILIIHQFSGLHPLHFVSFFQKQILTYLCCSISVLFHSPLILGCFHSAFHASCELYGLVLGCPVCLQLTCYGSLPCLLVLSHLLLFSRLNGSGETLGRKKTNFLQKPVPSPSYFSALLGSAAALTLSLG